MDKEKAILTIKRMLKELPFYEDEQTALIFAMEYMIKDKDVTTP